MNDLLDAVNRPDYRRPELVKVQPVLDLMADLLGGTQAMHDRRARYIRKWADEDPTVWDIRSRCEQLYEATGRTLNAAVGMVFARPPSVEYETAEAELEVHWDNIDGAGNSGEVFVKKFTDVAGRDGLGLILVDFPKALTAADGTMVRPTSRDETDRRLWPVWSYYTRGQVLSWRTDVVDNRQQVVQVVLWEPTAKPFGLFGVEIVNRYRVLRLVGGVAYWSVYEEKERTGKPEDFRLDSSGAFTNRSGQAYDRLPIGIAHTGRSDELLVATVPLEGVARANLAHYQLSTNLRFYLDLLAFPQPTVIGALASEPGPNGSVMPGRLKLGPVVYVHLEGEGADFKYTAPGPEAFDPLMKAIEARERHIGELGMSFLAGDTRQAETAEAKRLDATAENATLSTMAQGVEDAVNEAWVHHAWYQGIEKDKAPSLELNRDFEATAMDAQTMVAYVTAVKDAGLPARLLLEAWQKGGRIPAEIDLEELEMEMLAAAAAQEEQERQEREERIAQMTQRTQAPPSGNGNQPPTQQQQPAAVQG